MTLQSSPPGSHLLAKSWAAGGAEPSLSPAQQRLVVVSNRVADLTAPVQSGGLATGLGAAINTLGGVWFGWDGNRDGKTGGPLKVCQHGPVTCVGAPISPEDFSAYYLGFANSVLWPLFHYRPDLVDISSGSFDGYMRVNEVLAQQLFPILKPDDLIWVHDYHLIPLPSMLRKLGCRQRIGYFLHIPFPPPELMSATPHHGCLVDALLNYDLLGFQTDGDAENFKSYLRKHKPEVTISQKRVQTETRTIRIDRFPIGIDVTEFSALSRQRLRDTSLAEKPKNATPRKRIIGVDRLDYSKGLPERFRAFHDLLQRYPAHLRKVSFLQIAPLTRAEVEAYNDIRVEVEQLAGSVNGHFADLDWTPVQYICRPIARDILAPLMRQSAVGFITPLRDGMNLVAKEYVAAQDPDDPGVLVLSQFAGAAEEMTDALIVNPYDIESVAAHLDRALTMPLGERRERHAALLRHVTEFDAKRWADSFLEALRGD